MIMTCLYPFLVPNEPHHALDFKQRCPLPSKRFFYFKYGKACYSWGERVALGWTDAEKSCSSDGGHLMSVNDEIEKRFLAYITKTGLLANRGLWVGLTFSQDDSGRAYKWTDGWPVVRIPWANNEPDTSHLNQSHVAFVKDGGFYSTTYMDMKLPYMCKIHLTEKPALPNYSSMRCPQD